MSGDAEHKAIGKGWLAPVEAGRELGVTSARVRQLVAGGRLEATPTPLGNLISARSVEALRREREAKGGSRGR